ncbi:MAG: cell division protein CrgA [Actinomycetota bacterium]
MVRQDKSGSGRVTPKGGGTGSSSSGGSGADEGGVVSREPVKIGGRLESVVPIIMIACLALGTLMILVNYIFLSEPSNWYLLGGLSLILAGIVAATQWR